MRNWVRALAAVACCTLAACEPASTSTTDGGSLVGTSGNYGSYRIDPAHTGTITGGTLTPPLTKLWTFPTSRDSSYPIVVAGTVYFIAYGPADSSGAYAVNAQTGKTVWGPIAGAAESGLAVGDGEVVIAAQNGVIRAFDQVKGTELWGLDLGTDTDTDMLPVISNGVLYVANSSGTVIAMNDLTGAIVWTSAAPLGSDTVPLVNAMTGPIAVSDGFVVGQTSSSTVNALSATTGVKLWSVAGDDSPGWPIAIFGSYVLASYVSGGTGAGYAPGGTAYKLATGDSATMAPFFLATATPVTDTVDLSVAYAVDAEAGSLNATDLLTDKVLWSFTPSGGDSLFDEPLLINGYIYATSTGISIAGGGSLYVLDEMGNKIYADTTLSYFQPATSSPVEPRTWGSMGSDGNYLVVATGKEIVGYANASP